MLKRLIEEHSKHYKTDVWEMVELYKTGLSKEEVMERTNVNRATIEKIFSTLRLRWAKKYREIDLKTFEIEMAESDLTDVAKENIEELSEKLREEKRIVKNMRKRLQRLTDSNTLLRRVAREEDREDNFVEDIRLMLNEVLENHEFDVSERSVVKRVVDESVPEWGQVLQLSDTHFGEEIKPENIGNMNIFNLEVGKESMDVLYEELINFPRSSRNIIVAETGDLIVGRIHSGIEHGEKPMIEIMVDTVDILYDFMVDLCRVYDNVDWYAVSGNHSRITEDIRYKDKNIDYAYLMYEMLERIIEKTNLPVTIHKSRTGYQLIEHNGADALLHHGDQHRNYRATDPKAYGELKDVGYRIFGKVPRHIISGHTHTAQFTTNNSGGVNIVSGSMSGQNEYGTGNGWTYITPSQNIFFIEEDGSVQDVRVVDLSRHRKKYLDGRQ